jgi:hypothetical protein
MCGITGIYNVANAPSKALDICTKQIYRGKDATGLCWVTKSGNLEILKKTLDPNKFKEEYGAEVDAINATIAIGHNRAASTNIELKHMNTECHPFISEDKTFALVHNGTMNNHEYISKLLKYTGHTLSSGVDSELFVHLLEEILLHTKTRLEAIFKLYSLSEGNILILFNDGELFGLPSYAFDVIKIDNSCYIASEGCNIIEQLIGNQSFKNSKEVKITELDVSPGLLHITKDGKIFLYGKWKDTTVKSGSWICGKHCECDYCGVTDIDCECIKDINKTILHRCLKCHNAGINLPIVKPVVAQLAIDTYSSNENSKGVNHRDMYENYHNTGKQEPKAVGICYQCAETFTSDRLFFCTLCNHFYCITHVDKHVCRVNDSNEYTNVDLIKIIKNATEVN